MGTSKFEFLDYEVLDEDLRDVRALGRYVM